MDDTKPAWEFDFRQVVANEMHFPLGGVKRASQNRFPERCDTGGEKVTEVIWPSIKK